MFSFPLQYRTSIGVGRMSTQYVTKCLHSLWKGTVQIYLTASFKPMFLLHQLNITVYEQWKVSRENNVLLDFEKKWKGRETHFLYLIIINFVSLKQYIYWKILLEAYKPMCNLILLNLWKKLTKTDILFLNIISKSFY